MSTIKPTSLVGDRTRFQSANGIADWWQKDGKWHIARPCADPDPKTGLHTGGFLFTDAAFNMREEAIAALHTSWRIVHDPEELHQLMGFMAVLGACGPSRKQPGKFWYSVSSTPVSERIPTQYVGTIEQARAKVLEAVLPFCAYATNPSSAAFAKAQPTA